MMWVGTYAFHLSRRLKFNTIQSKRRVVKLLALKHNLLSMGPITIKKIFFSKNRLTNKEIPYVITSYLLS